MPNMERLNLHSEHRNLKGLAAVGAAVGLTAAFVGGGNVHGDNGYSTETGSNLDLTLQVSINRVYDNNSQAQLIYSKQRAIADFVHCQVGLDGTDRRLTAPEKCAALTEELVQVFIRTGDTDSLKAAKVSHDFGIDRWSNNLILKDELDKILRKSRITEITNGQFKDVETDSMLKSIQEAYETNPRAEDLYPRTNVLADFQHAQIGLDGTDRRETGKEKNAVLVDSLFNVFISTGDEMFLKAAGDARSFGLSRYGQDFQPRLDKAITDSLAVNY
jgi:hypothetical protein